MKQLKDLVPDIYRHLESLSDGIPLPLTEAEIDKTVADMKVALMSWATPRERNKDFTLRMSNIGKPSRQLWYEKRDEQGRGGIDGATQIKFLYGHLLEEIVLMLVRMAGHTVTDEQKEVKVEGILGHMDCKINGEVVDVKTASRFAFNKFREGRLAQDDPFGYMGQLAGYEKAEGTDQGGFLVLNKESGELCMYVPDDLDKPNITTTINKLVPALKLDTPPDLCYDLIADGKKGNIKLPKGCSWCKYKYQCHQDANDGDGLRTFRYSNGLTYLTTVVVEPKVEELL
jgi:hypothetical protein|tara:strand:- start:1213 stop:2070 length:858 start_codon:yes stop_codon:yes gene_type:complete